MKGKKERHLYQAATIVKVSIETKLLYFYTHNLEEKEEEEEKQKKYKAYTKLKISRNSH